MVMQRRLVLLFCEIAPSVPASYRAQLVDYAGALLRGGGGADVVVKVCAAEAVAALLRSELSEHADNRRKGTSLAMAAGDAASPRPPQGVRADGCGAGESGTCALDARFAAPLLQALFAAAVEAEHIGTRERFVAAAAAMGAAWGAAGSPTVGRGGGGSGGQAAGGVADEELVLTPAAPLAPWMEVYVQGVTALWRAADASAQSPLHHPLLGAVSTLVRAAGPRLLAALPSFLFSVLDRCLTAGGDAAVGDDFRLRSALTLWRDVVQCTPTGAAATPLLELFARWAPLLWRLLEHQLALPPPSTAAAAAADGRRGPLRAALLAAAISDINPTAGRDLVSLVAPLCEVLQVGGVAVALFEAGCRTRALGLLHVCRSPPSFQLTLSHAPCSLVAVIFALWTR